jgi:hypothetical protein
MYGRSKEDSEMLPSEICKHAIQWCMDGSCQILLWSNPFGKGDFPRDEGGMKTYPFI